MFLISQALYWHHLWQKIASTLFCSWLVLWITFRGCRPQLQGEQLFNPCAVSSSNMGLHHKFVTSAVSQISFQSSKIGWRPGSWDLAAPHGWKVYCSQCNPWCFLVFFFDDFWCDTWYKIFILGLIPGWKWLNTADPHSVPLCWTLQQEERQQQLFICSIFFWSINMFFFFYVTTVFTFKCYTKGL